MVEYWYISRCCVKPINWFFEPENVSRCICSSLVLKILLSIFFCFRTLETCFGDTEITENCFKSFLDIIFNFQKNWLLLHFFLPSRDCQTASMNYPSSHHGVAMQIVSQKVYVDHQIGEGIFDQKKKVQELV